MPAKSKLAGNAIEMVQVLNSVTASMKKKETSSNRPEVDAKKAGGSVKKTSGPIINLCENALNKKVVVDKKPSPPPVGRKTSNPFEGITAADAVAKLKLPPTRSSIDSDVERQQIRQCIIKFSTKVLLGFLVYFFVVVVIFVYGPLAIEAIMPAVRKFTCPENGTAVGGVAASAVVSGLKDDTFDAGNASFNLGEMM